MGWKKLNITKEDIRYAEAQFAKKSKFLVDENIVGSTISLLREIGWNVKGVSEIGLNGHQDEDIFAAAWREDRILLTNDRDFLNDVRFPEHRNPGIVVLPDASFGSDAFIRALRIVVHIIGPFRHLYRKVKVEITRDTIMSITSRDIETGKIKKTRYLLGEHDDTYEWIETV